MRLIKDKNDGENCLRPRRRCSILTALA
jgi:hypothetical protein